MSNFKVGQRVRIVSGVKYAGGPVCVGREAIIYFYRESQRYTTGKIAEAYYIDIDGVGKFTPAGHPYAAEAYMLAPLTGPSISDTEAADKFIQSLRNTKPDADVAKEGVVIVKERSHAE